MIISYKVCCSASVGHVQTMSVQVEASTVTVCVATSRTLDGYTDHLLLFVVPSSFKGKLETI